jgi:chromosome segregation ATPase
METAMSNKVRDILGMFAPKSQVPRKVRSVNLTDDAWQWLAAVAEKAGVSRNDYLEALAESSNPFIETAHAETEIDRPNIAQQPDSNLFPLMETVQFETEFEQQLRSQSRRLEEQDQKVQNLREQLDTECASREEIEAELSELKQNSASAVAHSQKLTPDAATILSQLRARRKKSPVSLADIEAILEIIQES